MSAHLRIRGFGYIIYMFPFIPCYLLCMLWPFVPCVYGFGHDCVSFIHIIVSVPLFIHFYSCLILWWFRVISSRFPYAVLLLLVIHFVGSVISMCIGFRVLIRLLLGFWVISSLPFLPFLYFSVMLFGFCFDSLLFFHFCFVSLGF